jgi:hypothetical protein
MIRAEIFPKILFPDFNWGEIAADPPWYGAAPKFFSEKFSPVEWASVPVGTPPQIRGTFYEKRFWKTNGKGKPPVWDAESEFHRIFKMRLDRRILSGSERQICISALNKPGGELRRYSEAVEKGS